MGTKAEVLGSISVYRMARNFKTGPCLDITLKIQNNPLIFSAVDSFSNPEVLAVIAQRVLKGLSE